MAKKEYILVRTPEAGSSSPPAYVERAMTWAKATNEITGLIRGILADGVITESEAVYFKNWIQQRPELLCDALVKSLAMRVQRVFADGMVTPEELSELKEIFQSFSPEEQVPTSLPLDCPAPTIQFSDRSFCFTGTFVSGKRSWCESQVTNRGGEVLPGVRNKLNFLVIGSKVSGAWRNQTYGKKIEEALQLKESSGALAIVAEDHWVKFL